MPIILKATAKIKHISNIFETRMYWIKLKKLRYLQNHIPATASIYQESNAKLLLTNHMFPNELHPFKSLENDDPKREKNPNKEAHLLIWSRTESNFQFLKLLNSGGGWRWPFIMIFDQCVSWSAWFDSDYNNGRQ